MLHAFSDETGEEKFAIVPENFVPEVKTLADSHRFYVDADAMAADVWFPSEDSDSFKDFDEWKTVLMAAQGEGGRGITCLDVTDPDALPPTLLFSLYDTNNIGYTTSVPLVYKIRRIVGANTVERFFAFFGGGEWPDSMYNIYSPGSDVRGNVIVAVDVQDAANNVLAEGSNFWYIPAVTEDASKMVYPYASAATVVNLNSRVDNLYDLLYIPDLAGQLWKVDLSDSVVSNWEAKCIFQPVIPSDSSADSLWQPAFFAPLVEREPATGGLWLFYGTGDRAKIFKTPTDNRFYAILDNMTDSVMLTEDSF
ncbi:MAG: PilC/PilY family type IV pilus protein, partial [candidate division WOR-3 bacterium]